MKRRRRNPSTNTLLLLVGGLAVGGLALHALAGASPTPAPATGSVGASIPTDIAQKMLFAWRANGSPMDQARWVQIAQTVLPQMTNAQLGQVYNLVIGFNKSNPQIWPSDSQVYGWVVAAAAQ